MSTDGPNNPAPPNPDDGDGRGRRSKCTPELCSEVARLLLEGNYRADAARAVGIEPETFSRWMRQGERFPDGRYGLFRQAVLRSETEFKTRAVGQITAHGAGDPWLMLAFLERKYPRQFGKWRGELGELKRRVREMERFLEEAASRQAAV